MAGCSAFSEETLTPTTETEERELHLLYHDDGNRVATVSLIDRWRGGSHERLFPLRLHLWKEEGLEADSLRYEFRMTGADDPPEFYLKRLGGSRWGPVQFSHSEDGRSTVLEMPDLGFQGSGSVTVDTLVENRDEDPLDLRVDIDATLSGGRFSTDYELTGSATREIPARSV